jgi:hypothetical protein
MGARALQRLVETHPHRRVYQRVTQAHATSFIRRK